MDTTKPLHYYNSKNAFRSVLGPENTGSILTAQDPGGGVDIVLFAVSMCSVWIVVGKEQGKQVRVCECDTFERPVQQLVGVNLQYLGILLSWPRYLVSCDSRSEISARTIWC